MITWILVANAAEAKIFVTENLRSGKIKAFREFTHPDSRKKVSELISDKPGHYKIDSGVHGAFNKSDFKNIEAEHFAIQLAKELKNSFDKNSYKSLVIVAPAHFYGLIKKHLKGHGSDVAHIPKDYTRYTTTALASSLKEHLFK